MANTREYLLFTDCTMANPNGDMINDNRPRCDEETGKLTWEFELDKNENKSFALAYNVTYPKDRNINI